MEIPYSVEYIADHAFAMCSSLTAVGLPASVRTIGNQAFLGCSSLTSVTIPDSVEAIGEQAFLGCSNLTSVTIPNSVKHLGLKAFAGCLSLKAFYGKFASSDNRCLIGDGILYSFAPASLTIYSIPNSVIYITPEAFGGSNLTTVEIPNSVLLISEMAFAGCYDLKKIVSLNTTPPTIDYSTFYGVDKSECALKVPASAIEDYKAAEGWKDFYNITAFTEDDLVVGIDGMVKDEAADGHNVRPYSLQGQPVSDGFKGIVIREGKKLIVK